MATRRIGIPGTTTTRWGEHLCAFFYMKADLLNLIVPYVKAGLEDNEFCLWITGGPVTKTEAFEALKAALPTAQDMSKAISWRSSRQMNGIYLRGGSTRKSPSRIGHARPKLRR